MKRIAGALAATLALIAPSAAHASEPAVINGSNGTSAEFPYVVALLQAARLQSEGPVAAQFCAGTLTTPTTVVTAAHCVTNTKTFQLLTPDAMRIGIGADLSAPGFRVVKVKQIAVHPNFDTDRIINDVAVITLDAPLTDVTPIAPASPQNAAVFAAPGGTAQVLGWGNTDAKGQEYPDVFQVGDVVIFPRDTCGGGQDYKVNGVTFQGYGPDDGDPSVQLCAGGALPNGQIIDACAGDSGGPLVARRPEGARLIGTVSWGDRCATVHPGVYTRISAMYDFLAQSGAVSSAPPASPAIEIAVLSGSLRITFRMQPADSTVTGLAASAVDPSTGATATCFTELGRGAVPASCVIRPLANGTTYDITAIAANAVGNSPATTAISATPAPVPMVGRIVRVKEGRPTLFTVSPTRPNGSALAAVQVICTSAGSGATRTGNVKGSTATVALRPGRHTCVLHAANSVGSADSAPVSVTLR